MYSQLVLYICTFRDYGTTPSVPEGVGNEKPYHYIIYSIQNKTPRLLRFWFVTKGPL